MMKNKILLPGILSLSTLLILSSCSLNNFFVEIEPMPSNKAIALKGSASLLLSPYFDDLNLQFSDDLDKIENAFKGNDENGEFPIIFYDGVRGLDLCEEYGNYAHVATFALGNQQLIPINKSFDPFKNITNEEVDHSNIKILANNESGSLGYTLNSIISSITSRFTFDVNYVLQSDREIYDDVLTMSDIEFENFKNSYDYLVISEPYATRLMTLKESPLYDDVYTDYTSNENREMEKNPDYHYCMSLRQMYKKFNTSNSDLTNGIPQTSMFVNINYYNSNPKVIKNILNLFDKSLFSNCIKYTKYVRLDFINLSEKYNDPNEDPNSQQTLKAFEYQFDTVGISWNEVSRLQAWHPYYGESSNYNIYINRLAYAKDINKYYTKTNVKAYYDYINKEMPDDKYFIEIKL